MSTRAELLDAIRTHPAEDTPRLMYADWLDEHGDCDRDTATAEFIRLCCDNRQGRRSRMPLPAYKWLLDPSGPLLQHDSDLGFPLPGSPPEPSAHYLRTAREHGLPVAVLLFSPTIDPPKACNWHRLVPALIKLDEWNAPHVTDECRARCIESGNRATPRAVRYGREMRIEIARHYPPVEGISRSTAMLLVHSVRLEFGRGFVDGFGTYSPYLVRQVREAMTADQPLSEDWLPGVLSAELLLAAPRAG